MEWILIRSRNNRFGTNYAKDKTQPEKDNINKYQMYKKYFKKQYNKTGTYK